MSWLDSPSQRSSGSRGRGFASRGYRGSPFSSPARSPPPQPTEVLPPDKDLLDGLDPSPLKTLVIPTLGEDDDDVEITGCRYLGSYNWLNKPKPTIVVPGSPPVWADPRLPFQVSPDIGTMYVDQNGYRVPGRTFVPLVVAVNKCREDKGKREFSWGKMDFVSDRNGLRKLLRWVSGTATREFRIDIQLAGTKTILLNRWEKRLKEGLNGRSYGFNFEAASTRVAPGCSGSTSHHRIVTYDLNGLRLVVRFEVDACLAGKTQQSGSRGAASSQLPRSSVTSDNPRPPTTRRPEYQSQSDIDSLTASFGSVTLASTPPVDTPDLLTAETIHGISVIEAGREVRGDELVELATRNERTLVRYPFDWDEAYPQLWLSQTPNHKLAKHNGYGRFTSIEERKLAAKARPQQQAQFKKLHKALRVIQQLVVDHGPEGRLSLVCDAGGEMKVYKRESDASFLPSDLLAMFERARG